MDAVRSVAASLVRLILDSPLVVYLPACFFVTLLLVGTATLLLNWSFRAFVTSMGVAMSYVITLRLLLILKNLDSSRWMVGSRPGSGEVDIPGYIDTLRAAFATVGIAIPEVSASNQLAVHGALQEFEATLVWLWVGLGVVLLGLTIALAGRLMEARVTEKYERGGVRPV